MKQKFKDLIKKHFLVAEIRSREGVLHFRRWRLLSGSWGNIYLHAIYKSDEDGHLHDHPWDYTSICLKGSFIEQVPGIREVFNGNIIKTYVYNHVSPFKVIRRNAEAFHKLYRLKSPVVYTLFFTGSRRKEWGYDVAGEWIEFNRYRKLKRDGGLASFEAGLIQFKKEAA
jgi:hypothetical protein